ncbi:Protein of unknown function [Pyronema omphalodes CBS 100304]|uniref:Uncharacterized protein n=1 Tax=Pyronema omphalodes (strain CBS 100304) TaxID=1076935 RepID=U4LMU3_PYROM|nr:Protein of unknown function [Pyronema omphalodes CBS 100304]
MVCASIDLRGLPQGVSK